MASSKKVDTTAEIIVPEIHRSIATFHVIGTTPLIINRMGKKARETLIFPPFGRMTPAEKASRPKHDPYAEYRASPYILEDETAPTYLALLSSAFKGTMCTAALDLPGPQKTQIGRLSHVLGDYTAIYGLPRLLCSVVRLQDMNRTPDIRTRAILPRWAASIEVAYTHPPLNATALTRLLVAAGVNVGVGDWRAEKGKGNYGSFVLTNPSEPEYRALLQEGRAAQRQALEDPLFYDTESRDLVTWWTEEMTRRGMRDQDGHNGVGDLVPDLEEVDA